MSQYAFGAGNMTVTQLQTALGASVLNPTPYPLMALQEGSVDFSGDIKELHGQNQFALAAARGKVKLQIKVKPARITAAVWNALFFGQTINPGIVGLYTDTVGVVVPTAGALGTVSASMAGGTGYVVGDTITASAGTLAAVGGVKTVLVVTSVTSGNATGLQVQQSGAYSAAPVAGVGVNGANVFTGATGVGATGTITLTTAAMTDMAAPPVNGTAALPAFNTFAVDKGCQYAATGTSLKRVVSAPAAGQYTVNPATGAYVLSAADTGLTVLIHFQYNTSASFANNSSSSNIVVQNLPMGYAPTFGCTMTVAYLGKIITMDFPLCVSSKMSIGFKNEDFAVPEFDFQAFDNGSGNVMTLATSE